MILTETANYPYFVKGQPLKSSQLNRIVEYLQGEQLDTRVFLLGSGIFYGLEVKWNSSTGLLTLSPGAGASSDGFLFTLEEAAVFDRAAQAAIKLNGRDVPDSKAWVLAGQGGAGRAEDLQMLMQSAGGEADVNDKVILVLLSTLQTTIDNCLLSYENNIVEKQLQVQVVVMSVQDLVEEQARWELLTPEDPSAGTNDPFVHRFGYQSLEEGKGITFDNFTSWASVKNNFNAVCQEAEPVIATAYNRLYEAFSAALELAPGEPFKDLENTLRETRENINTQGLDNRLPYFYDYLRDLVAAYEEFVNTDFYKLSSELPDKSRFGGYIALGGRNGVQSAFRMGLFRPPLADQIHSLRDKPKQLMERMLHLADISKTYLLNAQFTPQNSITPSAGLQDALSGKAIPFYYSQKAALQLLWNFEATKRRRVHTIPGVDNTRDRETWLRDMDAYGFFRVQGHVGQKANEVEDKIEPLRKVLHLPFDIKLLFLGTEETAQELISMETAWFTDLGLLLEKTVSDIRCSNECGDNYEYSIFEGTSDNMNIGEMFEALGRFFPVAPDSSWIADKCRSICPPDDSGNSTNCCPLHLKILWDLYKEYKKRKEEILEELFFHRFAQKHPGLEHNAGVPKGGTLVLVCAPLAPADRVKTMLAKVADVIRETDISKATDKEALLQNAVRAASLDTAVLAEYEVVADFCLPYTCCSNAPVTRVELREAQPEAKLEIDGEPEYIPNPLGWTFRFNNLSRNASYFRWELFDSEGVSLEVQTTEDINVAVTFKLEYSKGVDYELRLTAVRGELFHQVKKKISLCPLINDQLQLEDSNGNTSFSWEKGSNPIPLLDLLVAPFGGTFTLYKKTGANTWVISTDAHTIKWQNGNTGINFTYDKLPANNYRLDYAFDTCEDTQRSFFIDILEVLPQADFTITDRAAIPPSQENPAGGWIYSLANHSVNSNKFKWELFDFKGALLKTTETTKVNDAVVFELLHTTGVYYKVVLTAFRNSQQATQTKEIVFCPQSDALTLLQDGKDNFTWTQGTTVTPLIITTRPYGGQFKLMHNTTVINTTNLVSWESGNGSIKLKYEELPVGEYTLSYDFLNIQCDNTSRSFRIIINEAPSTPSAALRSSSAGASAALLPSPESLSRESGGSGVGSSAKTIFNQRLQKYRKAVSDMGEEDKTLAKTEKFGKTEAFLRFSGKQPELHNRYTDLLKSLQAGMGNAGDKRLQQVSDLAIYSTLFYLDRLLVNTPDAVPEEVKELLPEATGIIKGRQDGVQQLLAIWDTDAVANDQNSASITAYKALLA